MGWVKSIAVNYIIKALISVSLCLTIFRKSSEVCASHLISYKRISDKEKLNFNSWKTFDFQEGLCLMGAILWLELGLLFKYQDFLKIFMSFEVVTIQVSKLKGLQSSGKQTMITFRKVILHACKFPLSPYRRHKLQQSSTCPVFLRYPIADYLTTLG